MIDTRKEAKEREVQADKLSEEEIWYAIVDSFLNLPMDISDKAKMLFEATNFDLNTVELAIYYGLKLKDYHNDELENLFKVLINLVIYPDNA